MGDGEWMARLRTFASSGVWPSGGGNRPAPRQKKWQYLYQKIEKCPMQTRGQTSLFGRSMHCNCGFHTTKQPDTATQSPQSELPQAGASDTVPVPRSFLRPSLSLSMFTKSRFGGSQSLKPNLAARRTSSPSPPPSVRIPSPCPPSARPSDTSPSSVRTTTLPPSSVRTSNPSPSYVRTATHSPSSVRIPSPSPPRPFTSSPSVRPSTPSPSTVRSATLSPSSMRIPSPSPSSVRTPGPSPSPLRSNSPLSIAITITKKLAGHGRGTALWVTSIGNEVGQILTSVLSVQEGPGLDRMVAGVMERYRQAAVPPPVLLYVDCNCCMHEGATSKLQTRFGKWPDLHIRLDILPLCRGCTKGTVVGEYKKK